MLYLLRSIAQWLLGFRKMYNFEKNHEYSGTLICVEGIDGSGKSTQIRILRDWLLSLGQNVIYTEWNSSNLIASTTKVAKHKNFFTPKTFSIAHAVDFADRLENIIIPNLKEGAIILSDRYIYTAFARDVARGVRPAWVKNMYNFAIKPDLCFYFNVPVKSALERICSNRSPKYYEAGMDIKLCQDPYESFLIFQGKVKAEYDKLKTEFNFIEIDALKSLHTKQIIFRKKVVEKLKEKGIEI